MKLYDNFDSGNGYKVRLILNQLDIPYTYLEVDTLKGESRTEDYLAMNPNGRIPLLEPEPGMYLPESNAILCFLAEGTPYLPGDRWSRAQVMQWLFFEQYSHEPNIATPRFWLRHTEIDPRRQGLLEEKQALGRAALGVMEHHLKTSPYFAAGIYTIADIALYAYTHVAHQGGFDLEPYPAVRDWLDRVRDQPRHAPMATQPGPVSWRD